MEEEGQISLACLASEEHNPKHCLHEKNGSDPRKAQRKLTPSQLELVGKIYKMCGGFLPKTQTRAEEK